MKFKKLVSLILTAVLMFAVAAPAVFAEAHDPDVGPHNYVLRETVARTCQADGYELWVCECGKLEKRNIVSSIGHIDDNDDGKCDICGEHLPMYFLKHIVFLFLEFMKMVLKVK